MDSVLNVIRKAKKSQIALWNEKKRNEERGVMTQDSANLTNDTEIALVGFESKEGLQNSYLWVGDTGATCHMIWNDTNLFDYETVNDEMIVGDGRPLNVTKIGKVNQQFK
jgi:hypothetical protein